MMRKHERTPTVRLSPFHHLPAVTPSAMNTATSLSMGGAGGTPQSTTQLAPNEDEEFEKLPIIQTVKSLEDKLSELSLKVTSFDTTGLEEVITSMIEHTEIFEAQIEDLTIHQNLKKKIEDVDYDKNQLDYQSKDILKKLIKYRKELKSLPSIPTNGELNEIKNIDIEEVLKYGMKLSKFTKIPPGNIGAHPNNFIWPAEDSLRRGMLAITSLRSDEILKRELGELPTQEVEEVKESEESKEPESEQPDELKEQINTIQPEAEIVTEKSEEKPKKKKEEVALDLDLFDPEIDSD